MSKPSKTALRSIYVINKHAKQYAEQASDNYHRGKKASAKVNSIKKEALYRLKSEVIDSIQEEAEKIETHTIDEKDYFCFFFDDFAFHVPVDSISPEQKVTGQKGLEFEKDSDKEISRTLKDSLIFLKDEMGENANDYLSQESVDFGYQSYFAGWSYL